MGRGFLPMSWRHWRYWALRSSSKGVPLMGLEPLETMMTVRMSDIFDNFVDGGSGEIQAAFFNVILLADEFGDAKGDFLGVIGGPGLERHVACETASLKVQTPMESPLCNWPLALERMMPSTTSTMSATCARMIAEVSRTRRKRLVESGSAAGD